MNALNERPQTIRLLRITAFVVEVAGAAGSIGFMFRVGNRNPSLILLALFTMWVLAPFTALLAATVVSNRWTVLTQAILYGIALVVTLGSLAIYGRVALGTPVPKPAFAFLVVPLASLLMISIGAFVSRKRSVGVAKGQQ